MENKETVTREAEDKVYRKNLEEKFRDWLEWWPWAHKIYCRYEEILVYLVVGVLTTIVSMAAKFLFNFLVYDNTAYPTAIQNVILSTVSWVFGVVFAYFTNRAYVFKSHGSMLKEAPKFVASRISTYFLDIAVMQVLGTWLGINVFVATLISMVLVTIANYVLSKLLVFRGR